MDKQKLRNGLLKASSSDEEFDKYAFQVGTENIKTFIYGVITGIVGFVVFLWILWLMKG